LTCGGSRVGATPIHGNGCRIPRRPQGAIDKAFGIKLPLEKWTQEVNDGKATTEQYFVLKNLCARIDELVAAKSTGT